MSLFVESVPVLVIVSLDAPGFYACPWPAKSSLGRQSSPEATTGHHCAPSLFPPLKTQSGCFGKSWPMFH